MSKAVPKEGLRAPLFYSGIVTFLATGVSLAQGVQQSDLERCANLATTAAKLACFESLTAVGTEETPADAESITPVQEQGPAPATSMPAEVSAGAAVAPAAAGAPVSPTEPEGIPDEFGIEQLDVPNADEAEITSVNATVVDVEQGRNKILYFSFESGQVWRQLEGRRFSYPKNEPFAVVINTGMMGDYRLRLAKGGPMTRVKRVR